jgi:RsiW-degrading membrane proteinase PrsW (M82 family)
MLQPEVALIASAAFLPSLLSAAIVARLGSAVPGTKLPAVLAFAWGAIVASTVAAALNDVAGSRLPAILGADHARALVPTLVGPAVEELAKMIGLLAVVATVGSTLGGAREGIVLGALVGFGFAATENVGYYTLAAVQGGYEGLGRALYLRGFVQGANHAAFTAAAGAALGGWTVAAGTRARLARALAGLGAATALHALWNAVVSHAITTVLCNAPAPSAACAPAPDVVDLVVAVPALEVVFLAPIAGALVWMARRSSR